MSETKHSPTPWMVDDTARLRSTTTGELITSLEWDVTEENEAFLLRAVNAHEAVVGALKLAVEALRAQRVEYDVVTGDGMVAVVDIADAALRLAGESP